MVLEWGIIAALGAMLCWGFGDFFIQRTTRKLGDLESLTLIGAIGIIILLPFVLQELPLLFSLENVMMLLFLGLVTFVVAILDLEALKKGKLSMVDVILEIELPVTVVLGFIFFQEVLAPVQLLVISLIFVGIVLISVSSFSKEHFIKKIEKGVILAALGSVGMGVVNFLTAVGSKQISPLMAVWFPWIIFTVISMIFIFQRKGFRKLLSDTAKHKGIVLCMGVFDTVAWLLFAMALLTNELAITTAVTESYPAIAVCLGVWLNKEKVLKHQYLGVVLALASSIILVMLL